MSLVLYKTPNPIDLVHNLLFFQVKGTDYTLQQGINAALVITTSGTPSVDDQMSLSLMEQTHRFIFKDTYPMAEPPEGFDYVLPVSSNKEIAIALNNYLPLSTYYAVRFNGVDITITASDEGAAYDITLSDLTCDAYVLKENTAGVDGEYRDNYHFLIKVFVNKLSDNGTFNELPEFRIDPDSEQLSHIDLGRILRPGFKGYFELPDFSLAKPVKAIIPALSYYLVFKEMSDTSLLSSLTTTVYKGINARVNHASHPDFNLRTWINSEKKFLSNMPSQVYTYHAAKHYLYYLSPFSSDTPLRVKMEINSKDATVDPEYISEAISLKQDETIVIPFTGMLAAITSLEKLVYVSVSLINDAGTTIANAITFHYLPKTQYNRAFLFQNRWGVFDTLITRQQSNTLKVEKEENRRVLTPGYSRFMGDLSCDDPELNDIFTAETGPVTPAMAQHYKEMATSPVVFIQSDDRFIRVWMEEGSFTCNDEDDELVNFKFKYKPAFSGDILSTGLSLPEPPHEDYSTEYLKTDYS